MLSTSFFERIYVICYRTESVRFRTLFAQEPTSIYIENQYFTTGIAVWHFIGLIYYVNAKNKNIINLQL